MTTAARWWRFSAVSTAGFALQLATVAALTTETAVAAPAATAVGVLAAVVHNFFWHVRWTWADRPAARSQPLAAFVRFATANGAVSLVGNVALVAVLVRMAAADPVLANIVAVAACSVVNYWAGDRIAFPRPLFAEARRKIPSSLARRTHPHASDPDRRDFGPGPRPRLRDVRAPGLPLARPSAGTADAGG